MKHNLATTLAVTALVTSAVPAAAAGGGPHDRATGEVTWENSSGTLTIDTTFAVHAGAPGREPERGSATTTIGESTAVIDVSCVLIDGDESWFAGTVVSVEGSRWSEGQAFLYWVKDNATPSSASGPGTADIGLWWNVGTEAGACAVLGSRRGGGTVVGGNLTVHTAP